MVLNGRANENGISRETERKVMEMAEKLHYQPNQVARGLRLGRSYTLGLIVSDISNLFFARIGRSIEDQAARAGYNVIFCSSDENANKEARLLQVLKDRQVDGIIISPTQVDRESIKKLKKEGYPFVLIDRHFPELETNYVVADNYQGAFQAVDHLLRLGHRKIGHITVFHEQVNCMKERWRGYQDALVQHSVEPERNLVMGVQWENMRAEVYEAVKKLLHPPEGVSAIFVSNNRLTMHVFECLQELKLKIPGEVSVVSYDDVDYFRLINPPVTAMAQNEAEIGAEAVRILLKAISGEAKHEQVTLPVELKVRRSCGSFLNKTYDT